MTYFTPVGAVVVNTRGIGNRTYDVARIAAEYHWRDHLRRNRASRG